MVEVTSTVQAHGGCLCPEWSPWSLGRVLAVAPAAGPRLLPAWLEGLRPGCLAHCGPCRPPHWPPRLELDLIFRSREFEVAVGVLEPHLSV